jgi:PAS domain S-box-containing protein
MRLLVLLILIVPTALLAYIGYLQTKANLTRVTTERRGAIAQLTAATLEERFDRLTDIGKALANNDAFQDDILRGDWNRALQRVEQVPSLFPFIERLVITSATATVMADTLRDPAVMGKNFSERDWFKGVSREWKPYVSEVYWRSGSPQKNVVSIAVPVRLRDKDMVIAILVLQLPLDTFFDWSSDVDVGYQGFVYYVDHHGRLASHPGYPIHGEIIDYSSVPEVQSVLAGKRGVGVRYNPVDKVERLAAWAPVTGYGWGVVVAQPTIAAFEERDEALRNLLIRNGGYLIIILLAALAVMHLLDRLDRQIQREEAMLDGMGEGVAMTDNGDKITYLNPAGAQILHLTPKEARGRRWMEVAGHPTDLQGKPIAEKDRGSAHALEGGKPFTVTYRYTRPDGTTFASIATAAPVIHEGTQIGAITVFQDITDHVEIERERSELLSIASHQMRTPLTVIRWIAEMLLRGDVGKISREQRKQIANLKETSDRLGSLLNDLLNVSRLESGKLTATAAPTDLTALLKKAAEDVAPLAAEKKQKLDVKVPRLPKPSIDGRLIAEATTNLLSNAIKYTPEGGRVTLKAELRDVDVLISVRDTGIGIPAAQQANIFRKFFRAENAVDSGAEGTGLGLYVVKQIVELSGGTLTFESVQGKGTTFFYTLPLPKKS